MNRFSPLKTTLITLGMSLLIYIIVMIILYTLIKYLSTSLNK